MISFSMEDAATMIVGLMRLEQTKMNTVEARHSRSS